MHLYDNRISSLISLMYKATQPTAYSRSKLPYPQYTASNYARTSGYSIGKGAFSNPYFKQHYNGTNLNNNQIKQMHHANQYNYSRQEKQAQRNLRFQKMRIQREQEEKRQREKMINELRGKSSYNNRDQQAQYNLKNEQKMKQKLNHQRNPTQSKYTNKQEEMYYNKKINENCTEDDKYSHRKNQQSYKFKDVIFRQIGLNNIGNTCFMNSILQCMINLPSFNDYFLNNHHLKEIDSNGKVASSYGKLIKTMKNGNSKSQNPSQLKNALSCKKTRFSGYSQQDAQQFLAALLQVLSLQLNRSKNPKYKELTADLTKKSLQQISNDWWNYNKERQNSIVCDFFTGQLLSRVVCNTCRHQSIAFDNTWDFALNFTHNDEGQIMRMISNFLKEEVISNDYYCSKCKTFRECRRKLDFYRLPKIMILQIKRFTYGKYSKQKLNNKIKVKQMLNLSQLITYPNDSSMSTPVYKLFGIVNHSGDLNFGHYTADCYNPNNQKWYTFNDSQVYETRIGQTFESSSPYLLFYVRVK